MTEQRPLPKHYLRHARDINRAAGFLLKPIDGELTHSSVAISIGFSLHAFELCGKAMLRSLGHLPDDIRKNHKHHKLLALLDHVQREISTHSDPRIREFQGFLLHDPTIDGQAFGSSIVIYLKRYYSRDKTASPRNYLYVDDERYTRTCPTSAVRVMAEYLIEKAMDFAAVLKFETS